MKLETMALGAYQTNCYILWQEEQDRCVVVDPGYEPEQILLRLRQLGKQLEAILLTHGHFDHVGGVKALAEHTGCKVFLCGADLAVPHRFTAGPLYYTDTYKEGDRLTLAGLAFQVMNTPGHTPGSVCLICEDILLSGDTLFMDSCGRTDLPGGNWTQMTASLRRLNSLTEDYRVYPGHGSSTTLSQEKQWNPYLRGQGV